MPKQPYRMGFTVTWILRWGLLDLWDCVLYSSMGGYELASLPWVGSRMGPRDFMVCCLGAWISQECALNILVRWGHQFCPEDKKSYRLCFLSKFHCKQGCWMSTSFLCALIPWSGRLLYSALEGYELAFLPMQAGRSSWKATNGLCVWFDSSQPVSQIPWPKRATDFVHRGCNKLSLSSSWLESCWVT